MTGHTIHWFAPACATGALFAGVLFMLGHHLFYKSLDGLPISDSMVLGFDISEQQANIAIGTAMAFLAKSCLVVAVSTGFIQLFWYAVRVEETSAAPTLDRIDALHSTLDNAFQMFNVRSWCSRPALMVLAGLTWLIPIASILTPATLSVETAKVLPTPRASSLVPGLDFRSLNFLAPMPHTELPSAVGYHDPTPWFYSYSGPSDAVLRVANTVVVDGAIMSISSLGANASWLMEFPGPSLTCSGVENRVALQFGDDFNSLLRKHFSHRQYGYIAWFPNGTTQQEATIQLPVEGSPARKNITALDFGALVPPGTYGTLNRSTLPLQMYVLRKTFQLSDLLSYQNDDNDGLEILQCSLYNATYRVSFDYTRGVQNVTISTDQQTQEVLNSIPGVLYKVQNQQTDYFEFPCQEDVNHELPCCYNNPRLLQTLSYQAIMDAFSQRMMGSVYLDTTKDQVSMAFRTDSGIMQTTLASSKDLAFLSGAQSPLNLTYATTFQSEVQANKSEITLSSNGSRVDFSGAYTIDEKGLANGLNLKDAIEQVFQNFTVSLMSSAALQPNYSSPTAPLPVDVAYHRYHNIYVYSAQKLWLPYGIASGASTLAVIAGLVTMYLNRASYSNNFSTMLRAAYGAELTARIRDEDVYGQDPLPKYLAEARVRLGQQKNGDDEYVTATPIPTAPISHTDNPKHLRNTVRLLKEEDSRPRF